jgi:hypothetical protein
MSFNLAIPTTWAALAFLIPSSFKTIEWCRDDGGGRCMKMECGGRYCALSIPNTCFFLNFDYEFFFLYLVTSAISEIYMISNGVGHCLAITKRAQVCMNIAKLSNESWTATRDSLISRYPHITKQAINLADLMPRWASVFHRLKERLFGRGRKTMPLRHK